MARLILLLTGLAWATRSLLAFADPDYFSPVTALDWAAVWTYSAAWILLAPSVLLVGRWSASRRAMVAATVVAIGAVLAGTANAIEDGFGIKIGGTPYLVGFFMGWLSLLPFAWALWRAEHRRLAAVAAALFVGILLTFGLGGGLIILATLATLAIAPVSLMPLAAATPALPKNPPSRLGTP